MVKYNLIICLVYFLTACSQESNKSEKFKNNNLIADFFPMDSILGNPFQISIIDDSLLIINDLHLGKVGSIIRTKDFSLISRIGSIGEGPNEILPPVHFVSENNGFLFLYSRRGNNILKYDINSLLSGSNEALLQFKIHEPLDKLIILNDSTMFGIGFSDEKKRYSSVKEFGKSAETLNINYPEYTGLPSEFNVMAFQANLSMRPDKKAFVTASIFCKQFEIISLTENNQVTKIFEFDEYEIKWIDVSNGDFKQISYLDDHEAGFINVTSTQEYIYLLYSGRKKGVYNDRALLSNTILVYDWIGNLVHQFDLDYDVQDIAVDTKNSIIYGLVRDRIPSIVKYKIE